MKKNAAVAIVGTFDSKGEEHLFLKERIEKRGLPTLTINIGTKRPSPFPPDLDLYPETLKNADNLGNRERAIRTVLSAAQKVVRELHEKGEICAVISAGGGTGTHLGTGIMRVLPLGVPKVMVSTVASRDMANILGTKDITMIHSVVDILGVNSISGNIFDKAAGAICGMVKDPWTPPEEKKRIALTFFGFITQAAEGIKPCLEEMGYEVVSFHANGTGGMAMEELATEGYFHGILDLALHELADHLMGGYCGGIGPERLEPIPGKPIPRLVVPGGLDCAVLEFTRENVPEQFRDRKIFYYDFRSAIRLNDEETQILARRVASKLNRAPSHVKMLVPAKGWSEADHSEGPLYDPPISKAFLRRVRQDLDPRIEIKEVDFHINDPSFSRLASTLMDEMIQRNG